MIVADTSAIIAIVFAEPEREAFVDVIRSGCALAKVRGLPLLYKGSDFSETDIASAAPR